MANEFYILGAGGIGGPVRGGAGAQTAYKRSIAHFRDPLTPPQTKTDCIHTVEPVPGVILCDGWKTFWRYMDVEYFVIVRTPTAQNLQDLTEECLRQAAVAALLSALVSAWLSGGTAAVESAKAAFLAALVECLRSHLQGSVSVDLITESHWTDWE